MKLTPPRGMKFPIPTEAAMLIANSEQGPGGGVATKAYLCPAGVWTIGLGKTQGVRKGMTCTVAQGWAWFHEEMVERAAQVLEVCTVEPSPNQHGALVSLQYNIGHAQFAGGGKFKRSTVLQRHNEGKHDQAAGAFKFWNQATVDGKRVVLPGLVTRRAAESALYLKPEDDDIPERMPQAVAAETSLVKSPISQGGAATLAVGAVQAVGAIATPDTSPTQLATENLGTVASTVQQTKGLIVDTLGFSTDWILPAVLVIAGGSVLLWRYRQRKQGWA